MFSLPSPVPCLRPWYGLALQDGQVKICTYTRQPLGPISAFSSLEEIWNHPRLLEMRRDLLRGEVSEYCLAGCPILEERSCTPPLLWKHPSWFLAALRSRGLAPGVAGFLAPKVRREQDNMAEILRAVRAGKIALSTRPSSLYFHAGNHCNLRCLHCCQKDQRAYRMEETGWGFLAEWLPWIQLLNVVGGEPFDSPEVLALFERFRADPGRQPAISVVTNGLQATSDRWRGLRIAVMVFSVDGARPETYRKIRGVDGWHPVIDNVRALVATRPFRRWPRPAIVLLMTVMTSNYQEIPEMLDLARKLRVRLQLYPVHLPPSHPEYLYGQPEHFARLRDLVARFYPKTRSSLTRAGLRLLWRAGVEHFSRLPEEPSPASTLPRPG